MSRSVLSRREADVVRAVVASLDPQDPALGLKKEYRQRHEEGCDPTTGFCSVAVEAVWAMLGGNAAGYRRVQVEAPGGGTHWFIRTDDGRIIDPTAAQFGRARVRYELGRGRGIPVTRKYGALYRGDEDLLISNKAAYLASKARKKLRVSRSSGALDTGSLMPAVAIGVLAGSIAMYVARR